VDLDDVGALDRQLGSYERFAWNAAHARGWRPRALAGVALFLATDANDRRTMEHRSYLDRQFRARASALLALIANPAQFPARSERGLAMIDPRTRRTRWLLTTWLDGRRTQTRYADRAGFLAT